MTTNVLPKPEDVLWPVSERTIEAINFNFDVLFRDVRGVSGDIIPVTRGGTNLTGYTRGDLIYASGPSTLARLADVAEGSVLLSGGLAAPPAYGKVGLTTHVTGTLPIANGGTGQTTALAAFDALAPSTTKGDLLLHDGTTTVRLPVGADTYVLTADATQASGVKWAAGGGSPLTTKGDVFVFGAANTRLPVGADGYVLTADSAQALGLKWADISAFLTVAEADLLYSPLGHTHTFDSLSPLTTKGDLLGHSGATNARLAVGADGKILSANAAEPLGLKWIDPPSSTSPLTTKGDLFVFTTVDDRLPVGADGYILTADSGAATGMVWAAPGVGPHNLLDGNVHPDTNAITPGRGKLVVGTAATKWDALALGSDGAFLIADSTVDRGLRWASVSGTPHALISETHTDVDVASAPVRGAIIYGKPSTTAGADAFFAAGAIASTVAVPGLDSTDYWGNGEGTLDVSAAISGAVPSIKWGVLPPGLAGRFLRTDGQDLYWGSGIISDGGDLPITTKGDLVTSDGLTTDRLPVGSDGKVLTADSAAALGLSWQTPAQASLTTKGDLLTRTSSAFDRLAVGATGDQLVALSSASTGLAWAPLMRARVYRSANATLTTGVLTLIAFNLEEYDSSSLHDTVTNNERFTIPSGGAGTYLFVGQVSYLANVGGRRAAHLYKNGGRIAISEGYTDTPGGPALGFTLQVTAILEMADADYVELYARQDSGSDDTLLGGAADLTVLQCIRLKKA